MNRMRILLTTAAMLLLGATANAQHLWWNLDGQKNATCLYGQITVLATAPHIYYCGANWHPGEPAGGYCGIQQNSQTERRTIFSIWDTSPQLHPRVIEAGSQTIFSRFGGEGTGAHTHMLWPWKIGQTFQFFVRKEPGAGDTTDTRYYAYDPNAKHWLHVATISNPNGGKADVATLGGGMNSFLENFAGKDRTVPKLATYRLWLGPSIDTMKCLTRAGGDGVWGQLNGAYFLAEGDPAAVDHALAQWSDKKFGLPVIARKREKLQPLADAPLSDELIAALKHLPRANQVSGK